MKNHNSVSYVRTALFLLLLILGACMAGGGTYGTGIDGMIGSGYDAGGQGENRLEYTLQVKLQDRSGRAIPGVKVIVSGGARSERAVSDQAGHFSVPISIRSGQALEFSLVKGSFAAQCISHISPAGEETVRIMITKTSDSSIDCP